MFVCLSVNAYYLLHFRKKGNGRPYACLQKVPRHMTSFIMP